MDGHWCSQKPESGVTKVGDGLATEGEVGVVGPPSGGFDGNPNTFGDIGPHTRPGQPRLSEAEQMLTGGGPITNEGGVVRILQEVDPARNGVEAVAKMGAALGDRIHQGVHHGVKNDDRQRVTLVDSQLELDGGGGPLVSGDDCCEAIIKVGDQPNHVWRSMIVGQRERNKVVMYTTKCVSQIQPADTKGLASPLSLPEDGKEF